MTRQYGRLRRRHLLSVWFAVVGGAAAQYQLQTLAIRYKVRSVAEEFIDRRFEIPHSAFATY
jgi:hypothetical protein